MEITNIINQIGNTPLIKLKQVSDLTGCDIYGKAEYFNPGESVKDRAALYIVKDALEKKKFLLEIHFQLVFNYKSKKI